jgi:hypothetical protein
MNLQKKIYRRKTLRTRENNWWMSDENEIIPISTLFKRKEITKAVLEHTKREYKDKMT